MSDEEAQSDYSPEANLNGPETSEEKSNLHDGSDSEHSNQESNVSNVAEDDGASERHKEENEDVQTAKEPDAPEQLSVNSPEEDEYNPELIDEEDAKGLSTPLETALPEDTEKQIFEPVVTAESTEDTQPEDKASDEEKQDQVEEAETKTENSPADATPDSPPTSANGEDVDVPLFNDVIKFFLNSSLLNDAGFQQLTPAEKERRLLAEYNKANNSHVNVRVNFGATTSYNKPQMRPGETFQVLVPINPFCLRPDITQPMSSEERSSYEQYLRDEDTALSSGKWDNFPIGSRLFIGNLAVNTLSKEDVYRIFHPYGEVKQVNLKQGFGFVQFAKAEECSRAIEGEKNVPLHNRFMHLQVSKHQIQRAMEQQGKNTGSKSNRGRSRSPDGGHNKNRSRSPINETEVKVITSNDSTPELNNKILKRLKQDGLSLETEHFDLPVSEVPQEASTSAAYKGVLAVVIPHHDKLDMMIYEKTSDGGIRFDEYAEISINEAIELILSAKAKRFASTSREHQSRGRSRQNNGGQNRQSKTSNQALYSSRNGKQQHQQNSGAGRYGNSRHNHQYPTAYATGSNAQPFVPRPGYGTPTPPPAPYGIPSNVGFAPSYPGYQQQLYQQMGMPQVPPPQQQGNQAQLLQTMQNMDPTTLQNVLSLMQQMQTQQPVSNQQTSMPQGNALSGLLNQLQNSAPGNAPPAPSYSGSLNQPSQPSNSNNSGGSSNNNQDQTNDLFETLARLKNNM
ncbi:hypothetical protein KL929_002957 [Ogataea haglerorum]|uniref:RRM domain-containing protein n=1 Tax=Ogataea haglerorum TaxID=1937702 RepID=A0ABQ7RGL4_9ASCO|nr:hypothetical protein KL914_003335 [Ogataea haglerorum]KAG7717356.1 hypothetical protein KL913_003107 [Ogataea haglerorum]KAG7719256.1 hypothetical protein KL949_002248 [Ogataea haglerorum]KAG7724869.1 hypothetical protein KL948_005114 [Ogataea haglerorum]KAG7765118.1 hypothetical protein KL946_002985 [Ogataea haglerorum]